MVTVSKSTDPIDENERKFLLSNIHLLVRSSGFTMSSLIQALFFCFVFNHCPNCIAGLRSDFTCERKISALLYLMMSIQNSDKKLRNFFPHHHFIKRVIFNRLTLLLCSAPIYIFFISDINSINITDGNWAPKGLPMPRDPPDSWCVSAQWEMGVEINKRVWDSHSNRHSL